MRIIDKFRTYVLHRSSAAEKLSKYELTLNLVKVRQAKNEDKINRPCIAKKPDTKCFNSESEKKFYLEKIKKNPLNVIQHSFGDKIDSNSVEKVNLSENDLLHSIADFLDLSPENIKVNDGELLFKWDAFGECKESKLYPSYAALRQLTSKFNLSFTQADELLEDPVIKSLIGSSIIKPMYKFPSGTFFSANLEGDYIRLSANRSVLVSNHIKDGIVTKPLDT
ncbi:hypothetical protein VII00023_20095, partial [Vibrio ichthyoenteri ATCC 700023]